MGKIASFETIGIREFKANLSQVLKRVQAGERMTITHHGEPVIDLVPAAEKSPAELTENQALDKLERLYGPVKRMRAEEIEPLAVSFNGMSVAEQLLEDRGDRM